MAWGPGQRQGPRDEAASTWQQPPRYDWAATTPTRIFFHDTLTFPCHLHTVVSYLLNSDFEPERAHVEGVGDMSAATTPFLRFFSNENTKRFADKLNA